MYDSRFTTPIYTPVTVANNIGMNASTLRSWMRRDGLITSLPADHPKDPRLPFIALVEAQVYWELRKSGLSMQAIASGMKAVRKKLGFEMFKKGRLAVDGSDILMNLADGLDAEWTRARDSQPGIPGLIDIVLRPIEWGLDGYPQKVRLVAYANVDITADPRLAFGQPVIDGTRVRVDDVIGLVKAGESFDRISEEMQIPRSVIESVIRPYVRLAA
jgi:uncharacterized protein (DUF433 family)